MSGIEPGRPCASPYCSRTLASGEHAMVVSATWSANTATVCSWACLAAWTSLMAIAQRAADHRELHGLRVRDAQAEASA